MQTRKKIKKLIAIILCLSLILQVIPMSVYASDSIDMPETDVIDIEKAEIIGEDTSLRDAYNKHFRMSDGSVTAYSYEMPVHFLDENGKWQEYDNTLTETEADDGSDKDYVNRESDLTVRLSKKTNGKKFVRIEKDGHKLSWYYEDAQKVTGKVTAKTPDDDETTLENVVTETVYEDVFSNTDLQYIISSGNIKENIILKSQNSPNEFTAVYKCSSLSAKQVDSQTLEFEDEDGETVFVITAPYMVDADNNICENVTLSITEQKNNTVTVKVTADKDWLSDNSRKFPVVLDPMITEEQKVSSENWDLAYVYSSDANGVHSTGLDNLSNSLYIGKHGSRGMCRALAKVKTLPTIGVGSRVVAASMKFFFAATICDTRVKVDVRNVTQSWNVNTVTWNNKPSCDYIVDYHILNYGNPTTIDESLIKTFDITDVARGWYDGSRANNGVYLISDSESSTSAAFTTIRISGYQGGYNLQPIFEVNYRNMSGFEDYWSYTTVNAGRGGTLSVNNYTGNVVFVQPLPIGYDGSKMPVNISLIYNSNGTAPIMDDVGVGFTTNYHMYVVPETNTKVAEKGYKYYFYDADGTKHWFVFEGDSNTGKDEDGLGLTLTVNASSTDNRYVITDKADNKMYFNSLRKVVRIEDADGFGSNVTYNSDGNINTISTGDGKKFEFEYSLWYNSQNETKQLLTEITTPSNNTYYFEYDFEASPRLTKINLLDYSVDFSYSGTNLTRIQSTTQVATVAYDGTVHSRATAITSTYGPEEYGFVYDQNTTDITDSQDRTVTYQFNSYGQTTGVVSNESGHAQFYDYHRGNTTDATANKLLSQSNLTTSTANYVRNPMVDANINDFGTWNTGVEGTKHAVHNATVGRLHPGSIEVHKQSIAGKIYAMQDHTLPAGTYTLSCYVKTVGTLGGDGIRVGLEEWANGSCEKHLYTEKVTVTDGWQRVSVTYTRTVSGTLRIVLGFCDDGSGTVYFDDIQLEKSDGETEFNIIENPAFSRGGAYWKNNDPYEITTTTCNLPGYDKCARVYSSTTDTSYEMWQKIHISGTAQDEYVFGMWVKANSVPIDNARHAGEYDTPQFEVNFTYYNTTTNQSGKISVIPNYELKDEWQFVVGRAVIPIDYSYFNLSINYDGNANECYFTGAFVYKQNYGEIYNYDTDGNLITNKDTVNSTSTYSYIDDRVLKVTNPTGSALMYSYVDDSDKVSNIFTSDGLQSSNSYDTNGNLTETVLKSRTPVTTLESGKTYMVVNAHSGYLLSSGTTATGDVITNGYSDNSNYQLWTVTAVSGENNVYTLKNVQYAGSNYYLGVKNNSSAQAAVLTLNTGTPQKFKILNEQDNTVGIFAGSASYQKALDAQLVSDTTNTDEVINSRSVKISSGTASSLKAYQRWYFYPLELDDENSITTTNTYSTDGHYLQSTTDGFGNTTSYTYDSNGKVSSVTNAKGVSTSYNYNSANGKINSVTSGVSTVIYGYDHTDSVWRIETPTTEYYMFYDDNVRLTSTQIAGNETNTLSSLQYGTNNLLSRQTYGNGQYVDYTYDTLDRITKKAYNGNSLGTLYSYNTAGQLIRVKDTLNGLYTKYSYDRFGRALRSTTFTDSLMCEKLFTAVNCGYEDKTGRLNSYGYKLLNSGGTTYRTANFGIVYGQGTEVERIKKVTLNGADSLGYTYGSFGRLNRLSYLGISGTQRYTDYTYVTNNDTKQTSTLVQSVTNSGLGTLSYTYDALGNITSISKDGVVQVTYTYDNLNQLKSSTRNGITTSYNYGAGGNITSAYSDGRTYIYFVGKDRLSSYYSYTYDM
ncbi:MAG: DNRLRE domain-containing protein, partial [Ruminococcaceae bacterium]|nr:DNRLRE domain-containing protein [Oscillospiraceae bacterium]